ncbi:MAG: hypothetical protein HY064_16455 [Bacteroidetes bacterium]|nr:hypothetical protein [Bacteroidota bacterium]
MNEPKHPHFILSDAQYCHVLDDKLYIGKRDLPPNFPEVKNKPDRVVIILQAAAFLVLSFFIVMTLVTHYYMVTLTLSILMALLIGSALRMIGYTSTSVILREDIVGVNFQHKPIGFDFFVINYSGENGKLWKRRLVLYDSAQSVQQAIEVMKKAGYLK